MRHLLKLGAIFTYIANASAFFMCVTKGSRRAEVSRREVVERILGSTATLTGASTCEVIHTLREALDLKDASLACEHCTCFRHLSYLKQD